MGVQLGDIIPKKEVSFSELNGKILAVDAYNTLYQFLTTIRQLDGTPLMDSSGRVTSHLSGLFYRFNNILSQGIKPIMVFDGVPPKLKSAEISARTERKEKARQLYEEAKKREHIVDMAKFARQTTKLTKEMAEETKHLLDAMGIPFVQAPSEGEAQASFMVKQKDAYATASQDFDSLLFGSTLLLRNLTLSRRRKLPVGYAEVKIELIKLQEVLDKINLDQDRIIALGVLVGTDFNPGGYKGVGPKKAFDLVKNETNLEKIFKSAQELAKEQATFDPFEIMDTFRNIPTTSDYNIEFKKPDTEKIKEILVEKHEFSEARIDSSLEKLKKFKEKSSQKGLNDWF